MTIDILVAFLLVIAVIKGYQRGLIVAVFSFVAVVIGLAAAMKLSALASKYISSAVKISGEWLPVISFAVVFLLVVLLIRLGAKAIEKTAQVAMLGWINRLGGIVFYGAIYITVFSVLLFYATQMELLKPATIKQSVTYSFIQPWGPKAINGVGTVLPFFRDMFADLENFFGSLSTGAK